MTEVTHDPHAEPARGTSPERIFILFLVLAANALWIGYFLTVELSTLHELGI